MKALTLVIVLMATPAVADDRRPLQPGEGWALTNRLGKPVSMCTLKEEGAPERDSDCQIRVVGTWALYSQTYGGRIGIEHGLTKDECEVKRKQALGEPATDEEKAAARMFDPMNDPCGGAAVCSYPVPMQTAAEVTNGRRAYVHIASDIMHAECRDKPLP